MDAQKTDVIVIGAGIVGAAVAHQLVTRFPNVTVRVLEREMHPACHQTGRNSGVIHAGVYYQPNSLKAQYCREGNTRTIAFCKQHGIDFVQCGKLLVATDDLEYERMQALFERCAENGLSPQRLSQQQIKQLEPNIESVGGFKVTQSGITDYAAICRCLLSVARETNRCIVNFGMVLNEIRTGQDGVVIDASNTRSGSLIRRESKRFEGSFVINCAGIYADELAAKQGLQSPIRLLPFRGEYYRLSKRFDDVTKHLVYPIPDPNMPFLGVHLTRMVGGFTTVGPNAVLATGREQYAGISLSVSEWRRLGGYAGTWKLLWKFKQHALKELATSLSKRFYLKQINKYCKHITINDLAPFRAGIRAQAVKPSGELLHDFSFLETPDSLHVLNAPSPAATSALPIADAIIDKVMK